MNNLSLRELQFQLQILLDALANLSSFSDPPQDPIFDSNPTPDLPKAPPLITRPVLPFAEFTTDTNTDAAEDSTEIRHSEPQQDSHPIHSREARPTTPDLHDAITRVDPDISTHSPDTDSVEPVAAQNPFSYGYGYGHGRASASAVPIQLSPASHHLVGSSSGLAKAMASRRTATPSSPIPSRPTSGKRFSAPLPFTRLVGGGSGAVPVVDLGTAGRERGLGGGGWDKSFDVPVVQGREPSGGRGDVIWASWEYIRDRWVTI